MVDLPSCPDTPADLEARIETARAKRSRDLADYIALGGEPSAEMLDRAGIRDPEGDER